MTGQEIYLMLLGPALALGFGLFIYAMARWVWTPEYQTGLQDGPDDASGRQSKPGRE